MRKEIISILTIICFISIILIPVAIVLMWFNTSWKKKTKVLLTAVPAFIYILLVVLFFLLEPSINFSGKTLSFEYKQGRTAFENNSSSKKKSNNKKESILSPDTSNLNSIIDTPQKSNSLPKGITKTKNGKNNKIIYYLAVLLLMLYLIIRRNLKPSKKGKYENPYVDTNLYKLPFTEDTKMPMVHFLYLQPKAGEKILFATETNQSNNEGTFVVTNQRVVVTNKEENTDFPLNVLEAISSVSNNVILLTSGSRKYYIFMDESQVKYALAVVRWAFNKATN